MNADPDLEPIRVMYSSNLANEGAVSTAVGWNTAESQSLRFQKLCAVIVDEGQPFSVNDYGCGYGAQLSYLLEQGHEVSVYNGYDVSKEMLDAALVRHTGFSGRIELRQSSSVETQADYSFVSGTFNVRLDAAEAAWKEFMARKLRELDAHSSRGFAFNVLTTYVDWTQPHLYYADPLFWFDFCKRHFSRYVSLLHDYPLYEWTIVVKK
jgi:SAM-dependent methyltransferase